VDADHLGVASVHKTSSEGSHIEHESQRLRQTPHIWQLEDHETYTQGGSQYQILTLRCSKAACIEEEEKNLPD
jgi:hypothetical protein